jgi:hypothetical protein
MGKQKSIIEHFKASVQKKLVLLTLSASIGPLVLHASAAARSA